jgi:hypothetical protein
MNSNCLIFHQNHVGMFGMERHETATVIMVWVACNTSARLLSGIFADVLRHDFNRAGYIYVGT